MNRSEEFRLTAVQLEARGYTIDRSCYPWLAYRGPRFGPETSFRCRTPAWPECELELLEDGER